MEQSDLLQTLCRHLNAMKVRYIVTGSQATIAFGEPRFTVDIDVVVDLTFATIDRFCDGFPESEYYLSRAAAREAVQERSMFNVIHPTSGLKVDVIIPQDTSFDSLRLDRGVRVPIADDCDAVFSSPEDVILKKLEWHKMGGGERHLRDIAGVLKIQGDAIDDAYIERQATLLDVKELWDKVRRDRFLF